MSATPTLGILLLDTRFPRIPGDVGHAGSYPFPVHLLTVPGATVERAVYQADPNLLQAFIAGARQLQAAGAAAITSSCGFLSPLQAAVAAAVEVPVFLSSLMQVSAVYAMTQRRVGILTASGPSLTPHILSHAGIPAALPVAIAGLQDSQAFREPVLNNGLHLDKDAVQADVVRVAQELAAQYPDLGAYVLECHNLAPYARAVAQATGKPVFDIIAFARWVHSALDKVEFPHP